VADYDAPKWLFDKLLYVEKQGLWPKFAAAQLAERFDMAVMAGKGYAVESARLLAARVQEHFAFRAFVLHDADPFGYEVARTFSEATERMPNHDIEIVDLGLSVGDAVRLGLGTEVFTREPALSRGPRPRLDDLELVWFSGTRILSPASRGGAASG
jgi:hypothetical protein